MKRQLVRKFVALAISGGVLFQLAGCASLLINNLLQQVVGTVVGTVLVGLIQAATGQAPTAT